MIVVVCDTNVLATGLATPRGTGGQILVVWLAGAFWLVVSEPILMELARVLAKPYFHERLGPEQAALDVERLRRDARFVTLPEPLPRIAAHWHDDAILATVAAGHAEYLVTGDRELLRLRVHAGARIVTPREFLAVLATRSQGR